MALVVEDPSLNGWATLLIYIAVAGLCLVNAQGSLAGVTSGGKGTAKAKARRGFWVALAVLLVLLGLSRQLNLQALVTEFARSVFHKEGSYQDREGPQRALVVLIGGFGIVGMLTALVTFRRLDGLVLWAMGGAILLVTFTIVRIISLHEIDWLLRQGVPHAQVNNLIEIGLLLVIGAAAWAFRQRLRNEGESARLRALKIQERRRLLGERRRAARS